MKVMGESIMGESNLGLERYVAQERRRMQRKLRDGLQPVLAEQAAILLDYERFQEFDRVFDRTDGNRGSYVINPFRAVDGLTAIEKEPVSQEVAAHVMEFRPKWVAYLDEVHRLHQRLSSERTMINGYVHALYAVALFAAAYQMNRRNEGDRHDRQDVHSSYSALWDILQPGEEKGKKSLLPDYLLLVPQPCLPLDEQEQNYRQSLQFLSETMNQDPDTSLLQAVPAQVRQWEGTVLYHTRSIRDFYFWQNGLLRRKYLDNALRFHQEAIRTRFNLDEDYMRREDINIDPCMRGIPHAEPANSDAEDTP